MKKPNPWKKYGALMMAGVLFVGTAAGSGLWKDLKAVRAEEEQQVTLHIADRDEEEADPKAAEEPAETKETRAETGLQIAGREDTAALAETEEIPDTEAATETEELTEAPETETAPETEVPETETASETEKETEAETEQKGTFDPIGAVDTDDISIVTTDVSQVVENCMASIVSITNTSVEEIDTFYYGTQEFEAEGAGTGIIIAQNDEELLVATNSHVVADTVELTVGFTVDAEDPEDLIVPAKIKGMDKSYELAVVAVQLSDIPEDVRAQLKIATLGSSDDLKVGQAAIAIGNALGYGQSVTSGIISALNREITIDSFTNEVILTDAAINFGNSGGALLNAKGQVIGINVAKEAGTGTDSMGYSIPIDTAIPVLEKLINKETRDQMSDVERGYMGATVVNVTDDAKELYDMPQGAFVYEVAEDSAAEEAGIKKGDVITKFDGESVTNSDDLIDKMRYYGVGETVTVEIQTANNGTYEAREVEVTLKGASEDVLAQAEEESERQEERSKNGNNGSNQEESIPDQEENWNEEFDEGWNDEFQGEFENLPFGGDFY